MNKFLLAALSVFACSAYAAEDRFYAGGNLAFWNYSEDNLANTFNVTTVEGLVGFNVWKMINIEGRLGLGVEGSVQSYTKTTGTPPTTTTFSASIDVSDYASFYVKPELKNDVAKLYGLVGVTALNAESTNAGANSDNELTSLSYGAGVGFYITDAAVVNLEYRVLGDADGFRYDGYSVGFDISF